ncbi:MAG: PAS domain S-box protein [Planctomycetes bacterium]|nr:PAS domain S-box protein [Planctomycetota bacterium]
MTPPRPGRALRAALGGAVLFLALGAGVGIWTLQRRQATFRPAFDEAVEATLDLGAFFLAWGGAAAAFLAHRVLGDPERRFVGAAFLAAGAVDFLHAASGSIAYAVNLDLPEHFGPDTWGVSRLVLGGLLLTASLRPAWIRDGRWGGRAVVGGTFAAALGLLLGVIAIDPGTWKIGNLDGTRCMDLVALGAFAVAAPMAAATGLSRSGLDGALLPLALLLGTACQCLMIASRSEQDLPYVGAHILRVLSYGVFAGGLYLESLGRIGLQVRQAKELDGANRQLGEALARLRDAEGRYRDLFERAPVLYVRLDVTGNLLDANTPAREAFCGAGPFLGEPFGKFLLGPSPETFAESCRRIVEQGAAAVDLQWKSRAGRVREGTLYAQVERSAEERVTGIRGALLDLTEKRRLERQLALEAELVRRAPHEAILVLDALSRVIRANDAAARLVGREVSALPGAHLSDLVAAGSVAAAREMVRRTVEEGGWRGELSLSRAGGASLACAVTTGRILVPGSEEVALSLFAHDISDRKAMEDSLRQANLQLKEMDARKDDFLAAVSHELRTPLTGIQGHALNLIAGTAGAVAEPQRAVLERIVANAQRLTRLINDLLDLDAIESGAARWNLSSVPVGRLLRDTVDALRGAAARAEVTVVLDVEEGLADLRVDADRIAQVVTNVLGNAVAYSPRGGVVRVDARREIAPDGVRLSIADQGPGIPAAQRERIFEKHVRLARSGGSLAPMGPAGSGLGLAIARQIVVRHHGRIWVEAAPGGGSVFHIAIPRLHGEGGGA